MSYNHLTERRAVDRKRITELLIGIATELGATHEIDMEMSTGREIWLRIEASRGLGLTIDLSTDSCQPDVHVLCWHISLDHDTRLADAFEDVNPHHRQKATQVAYGTDGLLANVRRRLSMARDGTAFLAEAPV